MNIRTQKERGKSLLNILKALLQARPTYRTTIHAHKA